MSISVRCYFLVKLYIPTSMFLLFLVQLRSFCRQIYLDSLFFHFPFFHFSFVSPFKVLSSQACFFGFPLISPPVRPMFCGNRPTEITNEEEYDDSSNTVLTDVCNQVARTQSLDVADYSF